jgi:hypothetical protein
LKPNFEAVNNLFSNCSEKACICEVMQSLTSTWKLYSYDKICLPGILLTITRAFSARFKVRCAPLP